MPQQPIVSIVIPTFNRFDRLRRCLDKITQNAPPHREVIVVDGGSKDGTREFLKSRSDLNVILEPQREGAVKAFNRGFRAASGEYVMWLNDDAWLMPGSLQAALTMIERPDLPSLGMVAFYHNWRSDRNILDQVVHDGQTYSLCHVRGHLYANFGLLRRSLLKSLGFADERFYFFGFDPDLSLRIQREAGLLVLGCRRALIHHDELHDERKLEDLDRGIEDNAKLFAKWVLPPPGGYPDPRPAYASLVTSLGID